MSQSAASLLSSLILYFLSTLGTVAVPFTYGTPPAPHTLLLVSAFTFISVFVTLSMETSLAMLKLLHTACRALLSQL